MLNAHTQLKHDSPQTQRLLPRGNLFSPPLHLHPSLQTLSFQYPQKINQQTKWHCRVFCGSNVQVSLSVCKALNLSAQKYLRGKHPGAESSWMLASGFPQKPAETSSMAPLAGAHYKNGPELQFLLQESEPPAYYVSQECCRLKSCQDTDPSGEGFSSCSVFSNVWTQHRAVSPKGHRSVIHTAAKALYSLLQNFSTFPFTSFPKARMH